MNRLLLSSIYAVVFSSAAQASDITGDLLALQTVRPTEGTVSRVTGWQAVDNAGTIFYDDSYEDNSRISFNVTGNTITVTALLGLYPSDDDYYGFAFVNKINTYPGKYALSFSTFTQLPASNFYSTAGNVFAINLTNAASGKNGQLIFTLSSPVPEPESYAMLLAGLGLMGTIAKRRQRQRTAAVASA